MADNTFSHAILSASLVSDPELALGSGYHATCSTVSVVSLTAGSEVITTDPILSGGIGTVGTGVATDDARALSGTIGLKKLGAIGTHPVSMLLYNPPTLTDDTTGLNTKTQTGVAPMYTGTCSSKGYGNLNSVCNQRIYDYELISPEATETQSKHKPHKKFIGSTIVSSSISGITVALRTAPAEASCSRHQVKGHHDAGIEVQYYLGDPLGAFADGNGTVLTAGLSSHNSAFVGPEHARKRLLGF